MVGKIFLYLRIECGGDSPSLRLRYLCFVFLNTLRFYIIFLVVTTFAHALGVVRTFWVTTGGTFAISTLVVARFTHELGAMFLVQMLTYKFVL